MLDRCSCVFTITSVKFLAMYLLLVPNEVFADMQDMLPAKLPDIESEIYTLLFQKITEYHVHSY